jgi:hypothetical protein
MFMTRKTIVDRNAKMKIFTKSFTQQEALSEEAIERAVAVMRTGRLHRYNTVEGELAETSLLEKEFAAY